MEIKTVTDGIADMKADAIIVNYFEGQENLDGDIAEQQEHGQGEHDAQYLLDSRGVHIRNSLHPQYREQQRKQSQNPRNCAQ